MFIFSVAVISLAPYLTDKGERAHVYKVNSNVCISKSSKIINYIVIVFLARARTHAHTHARTHARTHTHTHTHTHGRTERM